MAKVNNKVALIISLVTMVVCLAVMTVCLIMIIPGTGGPGDNVVEEKIASFRKEVVRQSEGIPVKVLEVSAREGYGTRSYVGTAAASKTAYVSSPYPGKLVRMNVSEGDYVRTGEVLGVIESQAVRSSWEMAHATLKQAEDGYERLSKVHASGSVADVKMVEIETQLAKARSSAAAADKALEDCRIKAPFNAVVSDIYVEPGMELNIVENVAKLVDISTVEIRFPVPENELGKIGIGMEAVVSIPALDVNSIPAKVVSKGIEASPLSHTYDCTLSLSENMPGLKPGMVCKVYLDSKAGSGYVVPASVIRTDVTGRYVWTVSDGIVRKTYVVPGGFSGKGVIVSEGLAEGDLVITEGVQKVCSGMKVKIVQ